MKLVLENDLIEYNIELLDLRIYLEKNEMTYLFYIESKFFYKKYLVPIDLEDFKKFILDCLKLGNCEMTLSEFEFLSIQIIEKYSTITDYNLISFFNKKLGNLILFNYKYRHFHYLKNLQKYFGNFNLKENPRNNLQIKYLLILINNMIGLDVFDKKPKNKTNNLLADSFNPNNLIDFIYDFFLD